MFTLSVKLLGEFSLTQADNPIASVNTERLQFLLAYLLLHRDAPQLRQQIAVQLWPEVSDKEAKANLRRRLHELRQGLPNADQVLQVEPKTLQWVSDAPYSLDVADFEAAIAQAQQAQETNDLTVAREALEKAAKLYRGALLPTCYDDWIIDRRATLQQQAINNLDRLVALLSEMGDLGEAICYAQQLLRLDPLSEIAYCHLMRVYAQQGDRASALRVYHQCLTLLQDELGVNPSPTTCQLYEHLLTMEDSPSATDHPRRPSPKSPDDRPDSGLHPLEKFSPPFPTPTIVAAEIPLIGRAPEWAVIQLWKNAQQNAGKSELLILLGEPGIGKTRLLEELAHQVCSENGYVLWGRGFEAEMLRPYGVWIDAFRSIQADEFLSQITALLLNSLPPSESALDRSQLFDSGVQFIQQLVTHRSPVLIVLDDIQWLDEASVAFLHYAVRLLSPAPVLFALAARNRDLESNLAVFKVIQAFHREQRLQRLEIAPLGPVHTVELARLISQDIDGEKVFADSGGNPLFALEVARALSQVAESVSNQRFSSDLTTLIQGRLLPLDDSARHLVSWAAALGRSFDPTTLTQVANFSPLQLLTALEQLEQYGIIRPGNEVKGEIYYDFAHDIVRQVAYQLLSEPRRRLVHLHIARVLNERVADQAAIANDVAYHAALGSNHGLAATASLTAADRCLRLFAYTEAAEAAQQGIHHCQYLDAVSRIRLQLDLLKVYVMAGVSKADAPSLEADLNRLVQEARVLGLKEEETSGLDTLVTLKFDHEDLTSVHQLSLQAVETGRAASPQTTARTLARMGACLAEIEQEMPRAEAILLEAQSLAERVELELAHIYFGLGCVRRYKADLEEARQLFKQAFNLYQRDQIHWNECLCLMRLIMLELEAGFLDAALAWNTQLKDVAEQMDGAGSERQFAAAFEALINYLLAGATLEKSLETALTDALNTLRNLDSQRMLTYILTGLAEADLKAERIEVAISRAEEALKFVRVLNYPSEITLAQAILVRSAIAKGEQQKAYQQFRDLQTVIQGAVLSGRAQAVFHSLETQFQAIPDANQSSKE